MAAVLAAPLTLSLATSPTTVTAAGNKALDVLRKAALAQGEVTYSSVGTVAMREGPRLRTSTQTVFRKTGGKERIKIQAADGQMVWLRVCDGRTSWEHHPGRRQVFVRAVPPAERLRKRALFDLQMLGANYNVSLLGTETVAGRKAHRIRIGAPGPPPHIVREVWIDQAKYIELKSQGYGFDGQVAHSVTLERINLAPSFAAGTFDFTPPAGVKTHDIPSSRFVGPAAAAAQQAGFAAIPPPQAPAAFALYPDLVAVRNMHGVTVLWFQYTDGVRQFSVFERKIAPGGKEPPPGRGWARTVRVGDYHFTIVGQLSPQEFETITAGYRTLQR